MEGPPIVAVEVQSESGTAESLTERRDLLLKYGVRQVWIADPDLQAVTIHRPGREPEFFTASQTLTAEPELPGFQVEVRHKPGERRLLTQYVAQAPKKAQVSAANSSR